MEKSKKKIDKRMITHQKVEEVVEKRSSDNNGYLFIESFLDALLLEFNRLK